MGRAAKFILEPTEEQNRIVVNSLLCSPDMVIREGKEKALVWCMNCNTEKKVSLEMTRQIKKAKICPFCFQKVKIHKAQYTRFADALIRIGSDGYYYGVSKKIGCKPKVYSKQVAYWTEDGFYARNIIMSMYSWVYRSDEQIDKWFPEKAERDRRKKYRKRRTGSWNSLEMQFRPIEYSTGFEETVSKRKWLEKQFRRTSNRTRRRSSSTTC